MTFSENPRRDRWIAVLLFFFSFACYAGTLRHGFVYDDHVEIVGNPYVKSWRFLPTILHSTIWSFLGSTGTSNYYRPLVTFTHLLLWKAFGEHPFAFHLFSLVLNALVVVALYSFGRRLFASTSVATAAAVLFAVHPIHSESVNWISAVPDLEASLLILLAFLFYTRKPVPNLTNHIITCGCYLGAMLAKEPAVMLAPLLVYYEHFVSETRQETTFLKKLRRYLPVCLTAAAYLVLRRLVMGRLVPLLPHADLGSRETVYSAFALVGNYARLLLWPSPLSALHTFHPSRSFWLPDVLGGAAIVLGCLLFVLFEGKRRPELAFSVAWLAIFLSPALNPQWMPANVLAERYLYLPSMGFCWLAARPVAFLWDEFANTSRVRIACRMALSVASLCAVTLGYVAIQRRSPVWRDDVILYRTTLKTDPESYVAHLNLGTTYVDLQDYSEAEVELREALRLKPDNAYALNALACMFLEQNRLEEANEVLLRAIAVAPLFPDPHFNYGRLLKKIGQDNHALAEYRVAVANGPLNATARLYLGQEFADRGRNSEAEAELRESIRLAPSLPAQQTLAKALLRTGREAEAITMLEKMAAEFPDDNATHLNLASLYEGARRFPEAAKQYRLALEIEPENNQAREGLARLASKLGSSLQ